MNVEGPKLIRITTRAEVPLAGIVVVGRQPDCNLQITEGQLSRRHAQLSVEGAEVWAEDLGSTNGTFVNGKRIAIRTLLKRGDRVRFDVEEFEFVAPAPPAEDNKTVVRNASPVASSDPPVKRPGAWVTGEDKGGDAKTLFMGKDEIKNLLGKSTTTPVPSAGKIDAPTLLLADQRQVVLRDNGAAQQEWSIGADPAREIALAGNGVSALHAKLVRDGQRWKLLDQMSANGTFVNGKKITVTYLEPGDRLSFGPVEGVLLLPGGVAQVPPRVLDTPRAPASATPAKRRIPPLLIAGIAFVVTVVVLLGAYLALR